MDMYSHVEDYFEPSMTCFFDHCVNMASVFALRVFSFLFLFFSLLEETSLILLVLLVGDVPVEEYLAYCSLYTCENLPPRED